MIDWEIWTIAYVVLSIKARNIRYLHNGIAAALGLINMSGIHKTNVLGTFQMDKAPLSLDCLRSRALKSNEFTNNKIFLQSFSSTLYNTIFKRNSVFVGTIFASTFLFQVAFDSGVTAWYENHNKGKLWKDIKGRIMNGDEEDDDE